ncbi:SLAP domain-containing protein [Companilactobacillus hulinensis]|uniref:SLAP domain-containing protein n=1 Tax=Companilactobacillus hulinensis TaxID=2486007 RepID=UPI000F76A6E0|nr:SLAP domain-containing protein [Companilactobacillus hulinensis]
MKNNSMILGAAAALLLATSAMNNTSQNVNASSNLVGTVRRNGGTLVDGNGNVINNRILGNFTSWKLGSQKSINGVAYYKVATNEWVKASSLNITGQSVSTTSNSSTTIKTPGYIGTILKGGATIVDNNGNSTGKYLGNYTSWKVSAKKVTNGNTYYRVATNQWVEAGFIQVGKPAQPQASTTTNNTNIVSTPGYVGTITKYGTYSYDNNGNITQNSFSYGTAWKLSAKKVVDGETYYRVATNQWIAESSMTVGNASGTVVNNQDPQEKNNQNTFQITSTAPRNFYDNSTNTYVSNPYGAGSQFTVYQVVKNNQGKYFFKVDSNRWLPANAFNTQAESVYTNATYEPYFATDVK